MTVKELIDHLGTMPPDIKVVFDLHSESQEMNIEDVNIDQMIERNGTYMDFVPKWWDYAKDGKYVLTTVCHFPGN